MSPNASKTTDRPNLFVCIGILIFFLIPYAAVNSLPIHRYTIPFMLGENRIPFLPWTFIIYISAFVQDVIMMRSMSKKLLKRAFFFMIALVVISLLFFIFIPIEYPRWLYPSTNVLVNLFRGSDGIGNCFPSLHVTTAIFLTSCYSISQKSRSKIIWMWVWTTAIIISVLTTKQHYLIDIFGGIALAVPAAVIFRRTNKQRIQ